MKRQLRRVPFAWQGKGDAKRRMRADTEQPIGIG